MDERPILFVGDIQGCAGELALLLEKAGFQPGAQRLIPVGDAINRGPDAPGVLTVLEQAAAEPILGNHERALLDIYQSGEIPAWAESPRSAYLQLQAKGQWAQRMAEVARWPLWRVGPGWIVVHAGLHPVLAPPDTHPDFLTEVRFCDAAGGLPNPLPKYTLTAPPGYKTWYEHYRGQRTVIFGHWAQRGLVREGEAGVNRVRGLDTGCVYGRKLSGLWWPEERLVQVDALQVYRPVEGWMREGAS